MRTLFVLCFAAAPLLAQSPAPKASLDSAFLAWDAGDYPDALTRFSRLLAGPAAASVREPIALLTGEPFRTVTVSNDGLDLRWAANAPVAAFAVNGRRATQIVALEGDSARDIARLDGVGLVLSPDGTRAAWLVIPDTPGLRAARALADSLLAARDIPRLIRQRTEVTRMERELARVMLRDLRTGQEREITVPPLGKYGLAFSADGNALYYSAVVPGDSARSDIYVIDDIGGAPTARALVEGPGVRGGIITARTGFIAFQVTPTSFAIRNPATGAVQTFTGAQPAFSADGRVVAWVQRTATESIIHALTLGAADPTVVKRSPRPIATPVPSPDGSRIAYAIQPREDWEIYVIGAGGRDDVRVTREIQHDRLPRWVDANRLLAMKGEPRHTRSHLYDLRDGSSRRVHHNNTVRTVAPEYDWALSPDGTRLLIVADRDGNTISPERGVYLVLLDREVTVAEVAARVRSMAAAERDLRAHGERLFAATRAAISAAVRDVSTARIYGYEKDLFEFDSKFITQPGNVKAAEYIAARLRDWGYEPELQWFEPRPGVRTANVIATLRGTVNPELFYVVSSHFDSVEPGAGADDNTSGTSALLEAARVLSTRPQPATIKFAWFTGEEAGLLGSREFVRRAVEAKDRIVGALNNDMIGWANDHRLDNTIRYSNDGLRDLQHAAAFLFTDLITYDSRYYQNTDAHAYYEAYGDIVGGIGSYPILGNPHYHQPHDVLETINHQLVAEVSKTTLASLMQMASSPARLTGLEAWATATGARVTWQAAAEKGVARYIVTYGPEADPAQRRIVVTSPSATLAGARAGWRVAVKAVNARGVEGWDWARATVRE
jgi:hypothetical protein